MRSLALVPACLLAACAGGSPLPTTPVATPSVALLPEGGVFRSEPVDADLGSVSHTATGYSGEVDRYELVCPAPGRLEVSLSWAQDADYDLFLADDPDAVVKLAAGVLEDSQPEYVSLFVEAGQKIHVIVAGFEGEPGPYRLETTLLPPEAPVFALVSAPDFSKPLPRNLPLVFSFNVPLDSSQPIAEKVFLVGGGRIAKGSYCIEGRHLVFYPRLPVAPGKADAGLAEFVEYTLQFPRAALGPRAHTGEYLDVFATFRARFAGFGDEDPLAPPAVTDFDLPAGQAWSGTPVTITLVGAIDPDSARVDLTVRSLSGQVFDFPSTVRLEQDWLCFGTLLSRLVVEPAQPLPAGFTARIAVPSTVRGLSGDPSPENRVAEAWIEVPVR